MTGITTGIGLVSGIPIEDTVDQLMAIEARSRDLEQTRVAALESEQIAITTLAAQLMGLRDTASRLNDDSAFDTRKAITTSGALTASVTGTPAIGTYQYKPVQTASNQQLISSGLVAEQTDTLTAGTLSFGFGPKLNEGISLGQLNGGQGVTRGKIRITDRSGESQVIDLSTALTIDDVINAINDSDEINVTVKAVGDRIQINDMTGQTATNLSVQEVNGGTTAADLGLAHIDTTDTEVLGHDLMQLANSTRLALLNDGRGVNISTALPDLTISLADGSSVEVDLDADDTTIGDIIDAINTAGGGDVTAAIASDGDRLLITDNTSGAETFSVESYTGGTVAEALGLAGVTAVAGEISGNQLMGGLKTTLLSSLDGAQGLGTLGTLAITNRNGDTTNVDLSGAETLDDVIELINGASAGVVASYNNSGTGLQIDDSTGATTSNLIIADAGTDETDVKLGITIDAAVDSVEGTNLHRARFGHGTDLSEVLGSSYELGVFTITDAGGNSDLIDLSVGDITTLGQVIDTINASTAGVQAALNDTGDGIVIYDTTGGGGTMTVEDHGSENTAAAFNIDGTSSSVTVGGVSKTGFDGSFGFSLAIEEGDTFEDLIDNINALDADVTASAVFDGSMWRLSLQSEISGSAGEMVLDTSGVDFSLSEITRAQDAIISMGDPTTGGILISSSDNTFDQAIEGVSLTINNASISMVSINVTNSGAELEAVLAQFASDYNAVQELLDTYTDFNEIDSTTGILFGSHEALRVETGLSQLVSDTFYGLGDINSMEEVGLSFDDDGMLSFDSSKFNATFDESPESLRTFFATEDNGLSDQLTEMLDDLANGDDALLTSRSDSLQAQIDNKNDRIDFLTEQLATERQRLLASFYNMEYAISRMQNMITYLDSIAFMNSDGTRDE